MIQNITADNYNGGKLIISTPKPLVVDANGKVLSYIVDSNKDHNTDCYYYREHVRFKVTKTDMEVYYGDFCSGLGWQKEEILKVNPDPNKPLAVEFVNEVVRKWWEDKEFRDSFKHPDVNKV